MEQSERRSRFRLYYELSDNEDQDDQDSEQTPLTPIPSFQDSSIIDSNQDHPPEEDDSFWSDVASSHIRPCDASRIPIAGNKRAKLNTASSNNSTNSGITDYSLEQLMLHLDVDCFYCQVEVLDDPRLKGKPLVVRQFNSGGFVAVSYEAKLLGLRKGDGVGRAGVENIPHLKKMGAIPSDEIHRRWPTLDIKPMRTERYREVSQKLYHFLQKECSEAFWNTSMYFGGEDAPISQVRTPDVLFVEKSSYDDFYIDISKIVKQMVQSQAIATKVSASFNRLAQLPCIVDQLHADAATAPFVDLFLKSGIYFAHHLRNRIRNHMGLNVSGGLGPNKLVSRQASPLNKPDKLTFVRHREALSFVRSRPLRDIPLFHAKLGSRVCDELHVRLVGDLQPYMQQRNEFFASLSSRFGETSATHLWQVYHGQDTSQHNVHKDASRPKSIISEQSFPPTEPHRVKETYLKRLTQQLFARLLKEETGGDRFPVKLTLLIRNDYRTHEIISRTHSLDPSSVHLLKTVLFGRSPPTEQQLQSLMQPWFCSFFDRVLQSLNSKWSITRLAVGVIFSNASTQRAMPNQTRMDWYLTKK